ncbi:conjugal transfer protein MobB [Bacteroides sp.]|uniref:conjugal transfer protein MobB n=1 Tax=Bacteroides sp. TaxID=29523 RepID=UPI00260F7970|nr:conjugal transfer protein MobB [Bacteroides sp.]
MNKLKADTAKIILTNKMLCPQQDEVFKANDMMKDFELFMPQRYRTENPVFHVSLNPHPDDKLSDIELSAIAEEYMKRMGYGSQPYVVFKHQDISRHHLHIVSVRVNEEGKKINDKFERRRSKDITRSLEQKYGLHTAEKVPKEKKADLKMVDVNQGNIKEQVENVVREVMGKYHFLTFTEYKAVLTKFNIAAEEVKGSHYGTSYSGIVYSATDNDDNKVGNPFSAATLGKFAGSEALEKKYLASKEHIEKSRPAAPLKRAINKAFSGATTKEQLQYNLFQDGIGVVYRENAAGRLYGVTFIDHNTGVVLNGSRLGKEYAANAIVDRIENPRQHEHLTTTTQPQNSTQFTPQQQPHPTQETQPILRTEQHPESSGIGNSIGSLFDIPILPNGDDPEEEMFRRRMQRKKKKGRRM